MMLEFDDLVSRLPHVPVGLGAPTIELAEPQSNGLEVFIKPRFQADGELDSPIWLISAPAAVGKSFIAAQIANATNNLLWDLSRMTLGSYFFSGTMSEAYANDLEIRAALSDGSVCLVLDAMDEAFVRAGAAGVEVAMQNLQSVIGKGGSNPKVLIFGRNDTMADIKRMLDGATVETASLEVQFFSKSEARAYVFSKSPKEVQAQRDKLDEFLERFFDRVELEVGANSWEQAKAFLGYAPVLEALSQAFDESDHPLRSLNEALNDSTDERVWELLSRVVSGILARESRKFSTSLGADRARVQFAFETYSPKAQLELLLTENVRDYQIDFPDDGDPEWLTDLDQQVRDQFRDHPFRNSRRRDDANVLNRFANPVFRDYVCSWAIVTGRIEEFDLLSQWEVPAINPAPLLSKFVFWTNEDRVPLEPAAVGIIADSHAAKVAGSKSLLILREDDPAFADDDVEFDSRTVALTLVDEGEQRRSWPVQRLNDTLSFIRSASSIQVEAPSYRVEVGNGQRDFVLGPDVSMSASTIDFLVTEIRVTDELGKVVRLRANNVTGLTKRVLLHDPSVLEVSSPEAKFPWNMYPPKEDVRALIEESQLSDAGMKLRRILDWFARPSMLGGGLRYPVAAMNQVLNKLRASRSMFEFLQTVGYISRVDGEFVLELPVDTESVRLNDLTNTSLRVLLVEYLRAEGEL